VPASEQQSGILVSNLTTGTVLVGFFLALNDPHSMQQGVDCSFNL